MRTLESELFAVRTEVAKHNRFEEALERHDKQIDKILASLVAETEVRQKGEDKLTESMQSVQRTFNRIMGGAAVIGGIMTLLLAPLIVEAIKALFKMISE